MFARFFFLLIISLSNFNFIVGQALEKQPVLFLDSSFKDSTHLRQNTFVYVDSSNVQSLHEIQTEKFIPYKNLRLASNNDYGRYTYWLRLELQNTSIKDTLLLAYNYDALIDSFTLFVTENNLARDSVRLGIFTRTHPQAEIKDYSSNRSALFNLPPAKHFTIFGKIKSLHIPKIFDPILFRADKEYSFFTWEMIPIYVWNLCFLSILFFMTVLTFLTFIQNKHRAYLYYGLYIIFQFLSCLRDLDVYEQFHHFSNAWIHNFYRVPVGFSANLFYMLFISSFLDAKNKFRVLYRITQIGVVGYFIFFLTERILISRDVYAAYKFSENAAYFNTAFGLLLLGYLVLKLNKNILARYVLGGSFFYVMGLVIMRTTAIKSTLWNEGKVWNQIGILLEIILFWLGLMYKARYDARENERLELENQNLAFEKERSINNLRNQIAQDIHDEIGAGLTKISLFSQVAALTPEISVENLKTKYLHISADARKLSEQMREIIFAINPDYDNFEEMQAYFREVSRRFWEDTDMELVFDFPNSSNNPTIAPDVKRQLLLIFKEAQTNIAKHAVATRVELILKMTDAKNYFMSISDNGKGFFNQKLNGVQTTTKGLSGMKQRAENIGATISIETKETGTAICVSGKF